MLKGDIRKQQILKTAESFFTSKGYENTSIQDILNVLHLSKGSFYHHFESKEILLKTICENRAKEACAQFHEIEQPSDGLKALNLLISFIMPFRPENMDFLKLIIPVFSLPEGVSIRNAYQSAIKEAFLTDFVNNLSLIVLQRSAYVQFPERTSSVCLDLLNDLWSLICDSIITSLSNSDSNTEPDQILEIISTYRLALENVLCAPYGSILLLDLTELSQISQNIHNILSQQ